MFTESKIYVKKFLSVLYLKNIKEIPFSGEAFEKGINSMKNYLEETLKEDVFVLIEELFDKTPVQEHYNNFQDMILNFNGEIVKIFEVYNSSWKRVSVEFISSKEAERILNDNSIFAIDKTVIQKAAEIFCENLEIC